ncbi:hypothetical protein [Chengkuizengella sediminis]|uniref:hypothetical protein n=1 Tax=Chengkuizengella sediminis TaxID=1885917 RepID=UPI001389F4C9|nr:hypothetical protein [Chengkuizengella sediminis]NDI35631.1 hypothetical protein [Chengkuizengella sediminis]
MDLFGYGDYKFSNFHERTRHRLYEEFEKLEGKKSLKSPKETDLFNNNYKKYR